MGGWCVTYAYEFSRVVILVLFLSNHFRLCFNPSWRLEQGSSYTACNRFCAGDRTFLLQMEPKSRRQIVFGSCIRCVIVFGSCIRCVIVSGSCIRCVIVSGSCIRCVIVFGSCIRSVAWWQGGPRGPGPPWGAWPRKSRGRQNWHFQEKYYANQRICKWLKFPLRWWHKLTYSLTLYGPPSRSLPYSRDWLLTLLTTGGICPPGLIGCRRTRG